MAVEPIARIVEMRKTYQMGTVQVEALRGVSLELCPGEYVAIMGPSGCGKSTLLSLLGCLDRPTSGSYHLGDQDVSELDDDTLSTIRGTRIGFIFQSYNLIPQLSVLENIEVPLYYQDRPEHESRTVAEELAELVGLKDRMNHRPFELSGGQQQRVAIARALANEPLIILGDEPTGNLDTKSGADILSLFDELHEQGKTIVMVTHDDDIGRRSDRTIRLRDGQIEHDVRN
ncbi:MAG: ABC transporter ATP-binding protein [bacterium]|nr:ABC transporter ATP-binding protein [bacterium]